MEGKGFDCTTEENININNHIMVLMLSLSGCLGNPVRKD